MKRQYENENSEAFLVEDAMNTFEKTAHRVKEIVGFDFDFTEFDKALKELEDRLAEIVAFNEEAKKTLPALERALRPSAAEFDEGMTAKYGDTVQDQEYKYGEQREATE